MAKSKDMIGKTGGIGVVFLDAQIRFVVKRLLGQGDPPPSALTGGSSSGGWMYRARP